MSKKIILIIILIFVIVILAQTNTYAIYNISSCTDDPNISGEWHLNQSISISGECLRVSVNNVILDCNGYTISGDGTGEGIHVNTIKDNVTIKNCIINGFNYGLSYYDSNPNGYIDNVTSTNNTELGAYLWKTKPLIINNSDFSNNHAQGIYIGDSYTDMNGHKIQNTISGTGQAVYFAKSQTGLNINGATYSTLFLYNISYSTFTNFDVSNGGGVALFKSNNNNFNNIISDNNFEGICLQHSNNNIFTGITIRDTIGWAGINFKFTSNNNTFNNVICTGSTKGISINGDNNTILNSDFRDNSAYSISITGSNNTILSSELINASLITGTGLLNSNFSGNYYNDFISQPYLISGADCGTGACDLTAMLESISTIQPSNSDSNIFPFQRSITSIITIALIYLFLTV